VQARSNYTTGFEGRTYVVGTALHFNMEQWSIQALMIDGRCAQISYSKPGTWSEDQIATVFNSNGSMSNWKATPPDGPLLFRHWKRNDGATARWGMSGPELTHPAYERRLAVLKAKAEAESHRPPKL
jgi:hypothetical protein